jgi:hypothetical protein
MLEEETIKQAYIAQTTDRDVVQSKVRIATGEYLTWI